jgi:hypothetical protein
MTAMPLDPVKPVNQASRPKSSEGWRIIFRYFDPGFFKVILMRALFQKQNHYIFKNHSESS